MKIIDIPEDIDKKPPTFLLPVFERVITEGDATEHPIFIVSITGVLRSGKSFLLHLMKLYLDYYIAVGNC